MAITPQGTLDLTIPALAPSLNGAGGLMRMHWSKLKKIKDRWLILVLEASKGRRMRGPCTIHVQRYYARLPLEWDNAYASLKILLDALRYARIIEDDSIDVLLNVTIGQTKVAKVAEQRTEVRIVPAEAQ